MTQSQKNCLILAHKNSCERQDGAIALFCLCVRKSVFVLHFGLFCVGKEASSNLQEFCDSLQKIFNGVVEG